jgi:hypothetical protein
MPEAETKPKVEVMQQAIKGKIDNVHLVAPLYINSLVKHVRYHHRRDGTHCFLCDEAGEVLVEGQAHYVDGDQWSRKVGRKISLARAFSALDIKNRRSNHDS